VYDRIEKMIFCSKFSLAPTSTRDATLFALAMKRDPYLRHFYMYNPNCWCKESCDPNFTDIKHPCKGTAATCFLPDAENFTAEGRPQATTCWRIAFRFHQQESKDTNGCMLQLMEPQGLGDGQKIQTEMAEQVDLKVFRVMASRGCTYRHLRPLREAVMQWYGTGCAKQDMEILHLK